MRRRHPGPIPTLWLMTDERMGGGLIDAVRRLPVGSGVVFRHYRTPSAERRRLFARVRSIARARRLVLLRAGPMRLRGEDGVHGRRTTGGGLHSAPVHSRREAVVAARSGADLMFVSPVFATRSHPTARPIGPRRAAVMVQGLGVPAIALGGMSARRFARLRSMGFAGWAGIDAFARDQKRNAVPR